MTRAWLRFGGLITSIGLVSTGGLALSPTVAAAANTARAAHTTRAASMAPAVNTVSILAGNGMPGAAVAGPATGTSVGTTTYGVAVDSHGNTFFEDDQNYFVYKVSRTGSLTVVAGNGTDTTPTPGPALDSSIGLPVGLAVDPNGNLYIADNDNDHVYKVNSAGSLSIFAGNGLAGPVTAGPALNQPIGKLDGIAFDPSGNLYIASQSNNQLYKETSGEQLSVFAGIYATSAPAVAGPATATSIGFPEGIATDRYGSVYVDDGSYGFVYKVTPAGVLSILAGDGLATPPVAGPATHTSIGSPQGITVDRSGNVYITDIDNYLVYKVTPTGALSFLFGMTGNNTKATPGPASSTTAGNPYGIAVDANYNVIVSDSGNHYIYKITSAAVPDGGYYLGASDGGIFAYGDAGFHGSAGGMHLNKPILGMAATPDGGGYWLVASDGGIFAYGDAGFYGSAGGMHINEPIEGMAATPDGRGYWLVASDGGIFAYGDAGFYGSAGGMHLNQPIVGMASSADGGGYWLVASDGGIFSYGDAGFYGSEGGAHLNKPILAMGATPDSRGYLFVASDGGVFAFGDAVFHGSAGGMHLNQPIVAMAVTP